MLTFFDLLVSDYTVQIIVLGTGFLGALLGLLGCFAVLQKQSLIGDALSHAALPGIVLAFIIFQVKSNVVLLSGAMISGILGSYWINSIVRRTHLKTDAALGIVLAVFFGFGMLLLTAIQKQPDAAQAGLETYLFGQAATMMVEDVVAIIVVFIAVLAILVLFFKDFKLMLFDKAYAQTLGRKTSIFEMLSASLIIVAIVLGLQTVGVVLMSAMLLAPAAAARQWTNKLSGMLMFALIIGALSGVTGAAISTAESNLPTGPLIVLVAVGIVTFSFFFAPKRGLVFRWRKNRKKSNELNNWNDDTATI